LTSTSVKHGQERSLDSVFRGAVVSAQRKHALDRLSDNWAKNIALEVSRKDHWNGIADVIDQHKLLG